MENRKKVYTSQYNHQALIMKDILSRNGIDVLTYNHKDSSAMTVGSVELYVHFEDVEKALELVKSNG